MTFWACSRVRLSSEEGELLLGLCLVLVDEDLDDVGVRHKLRHYETRRGLVGAR
jgi:hypothetical protein